MSDTPISRPPWSGRKNKSRPTTSEILTQRSLIPKQWPASIAAWLTAWLLTISLVLPGCAGKQVVAQPRPALPAPPQELMEDPPTLDLLKPHQLPMDMRTSASGLKPTVP